MPIVWGGADTIAIAEAEVETAPLQYRNRIIAGACDIIVGPALPIPIGRCIDQHQEPL